MRSLNNNKDLAGYSLLANCTPARSLPLALAHCLAVCKPGKDIARLLILNRLFTGMLWKQQQECRAELLRCRQARRGETLAEVVS